MRNLGTRLKSIHKSAIVISIHALLAESDLRVLDGSKSSIISIHALLAESEAKVHKTVGHFCAYETNFMEIASSC